MAGVREIPQRGQVGVLDPVVGGQVDLRLAVFVVHPAAQPLDGGDPILDLDLLGSRCLGPIVPLVSTIAPGDVVLADLDDLAFADQDAEAVLGVPGATEAEPEDARVVAGEVHHAQHLEHD
jgi:hypothetical protein